MVSPDGRYHIVFNGEIYNHIELRRSLEAEGHRFRGTSDTEVLLTLFSQQGVNCLNRLDGMFAFAVYDALERELWLARDPLGEKPLYVVEREGLFAFASEVRALVAGGLASADPDLEGINFLLRQGSVPPPHTHLRDVRFLPPACWHRVDRSGHRLRSERYWTIPFVPEAQALANRAEVLERLRGTLRSSVALRGRADVPVGAFLSGGLDSTAVCAVLVNAGFTNLQTFTVTLPGHPSDECERAKRIASHLGLSHTEIPLDADMDPSWLEQALDDMDVPSIDGPNTWLVSRAVHSAGMKVACSGIGGDELFFGYPSFQVVPKWRRRTRWLCALWGTPRMNRAIAAHLPAVPRWSRMAEALLAGGSIAALWFAKRGLFSAAEVRELLSDAARNKSAPQEPYLRLNALDCPEGLSPQRQVSFYELRVYLHDQLLRDTDAMSMAHSLEVRVPLIARPVVELVAGLASETQGEAKSLLRDAISGQIPREMMRHPKQGFSLDWQRIWESQPAQSAPLTSRLIKWETVHRFHLRGQRRSDIVPPSLVISALDRALRAAERLAS